MPPPGRAESWILRSGRCARCTRPVGWPCTRDSLCEGVPRHGRTDQARRSLRSWQPPRSAAAGRRVSEQNHPQLAGPRVAPLEALEAVIDTAGQLGLAVHLDGARIFNRRRRRSAPPQPTDASPFVTACFSKGLTHPLGAVQPTSADLLRRACRGSFSSAARCVRRGGCRGRAPPSSTTSSVAEDHARARRPRSGSPPPGCRSTRRRQRRTSAGLTSRRRARCRRGGGAHTRRGSAGAAPTGRPAGSHVPRRHGRRRGAGIRGDPARWSRCARLRGSPPSSGARRCTQAEGRAEHQRSRLREGEVLWAAVGRPAESGEGRDAGLPVLDRLDHEDSRPGMARAARRRRAEARGHARPSPAGVRARDTDAAANAFAPVRGCSEVPGEYWDDRVSDREGLYEALAATRSWAGRLTTRTWPYALLGEVVARRSGRVRRCMNERIVRPVGLERTTWEPKQPSSARRAMNVRGHRREPIPTYRAKRPSGRLWRHRRRPRPLGVNTCLRQLPTFSARRRRPPR